MLAERHLTTRRLIYPQYHPEYKHKRKIPLASVPEPHRVLSTQKMEFQTVPPHYRINYASILLAHRSLHHLT